MAARKRTSKKVVITGAAGFIGFHLAQRLLEEGWMVVGVDAFSPYYDPRMKKRRITLLEKYPRFSFTKLDLANYEKWETLLTKAKPDEVIHLAAQPGVRYSLTNPWTYIKANDLGTLNVFEAAKRLALPRVIYASSSSVYGANDRGPMKESDRVDRPISMYAATKRANELMAYAYHHLYGTELIGLRFFTVYGTWYRPDLALFKFTKKILAGEPIDVYNRGRMSRSFTHVSDVVAGIKCVLATTPKGRYEIYNLGGAAPVALVDFIAMIERAAGVKAKKHLMPMQPGDVPETVADWSKAKRDLGFTPQKPTQDGIIEFVAWFRENERFLRSLHDAKQ